MDSRTRLIRALKQLAHDRPLAEIGYRELARVAGVSEPTARRRLGDRAGFAALLQEDEAGSPDTRARVLAAAERVFSAHGYAGSSLDAVARAADMTKGAIYWHFASKAELFYALLERRCRDDADSVDAELTPEFVNRAGLADLQDLLARLTERIIADRHWPRLLVEFIAHAREPDIAERLAALYRRTYAQIGDMHRRLVEAGRVRAAIDVDVAARFWTAMMDGLIIGWLADPDGTDLPGLAREFTRIAWEGMGITHSKTGEP